MSAAKPDQADRARRLREQGLSQAQIARHLGVSRRRVRQVLVDGEGDDELHESVLAEMRKSGPSALTLLRAHEAALVARIRRELRHLRATREEIQCLIDDDILGLTLPDPEPSDTMRPCQRPPSALRVTIG